MSRFNRCQILQKIRNPNQFLKTKLFVSSQFLTGQAVDQRCVFLADLPIQVSKMVFIYTATCNLLVWNIRLKLITRPTIKLIWERNSTCSLFRADGSHCQEGWSEAWKGDGWEEMISMNTAKPCSKVVLDKFSNNETTVQLGEPVRNQDIFIIQTGVSTSTSFSSFSSPWGSCHRWSELQRCHRRAPSSHQRLQARLCWVNHGDWKKDDQNHPFLIS